MRRTRRLFHGGELFRLMSMAGMLVVLGSILVMNRATDRRVHQPSDEVENRTSSTTAASDQPPRTDVTQNESGIAKESHETTAAEFDPSLTDLDQEQRQAAIEEFEAITDKTTEIHREEMPAYWRVMTWVQHQPLDALKKRAKTNLLLNDLRQESALHRGELIRLEVNVRRVLSYDVPQNPLNVKRLYEIWGWTRESQAWPYVMVTSEIPPGLPVGPDVSGRAIFCGYFFKLQGYLEAGAKPRDRPLAAPLLLGRLEMRPQVKPPLAGREAPWVIVGACVLGVFFVGRIAWLILKRARIKAPIATPQKVRNVPADEWLAGVRRANTSTPPPEDFSSDVYEE